MRMGAPNTIGGSRGRSLLAVFGFACVLVPTAAGQQVQLNQNCIVSVLNRNTNVNPDGSWVLPNVPANFGQVRARATCVNNGNTVSGQSAYFTLPANGTVNLPHIQLGNTTPIPSTLIVTAPSTTMTSIGAHVQLTVTATYTGSPTQNVTAASSGTAYATTNPAIATVSADGLVTAVATGTVVISASNEGTGGFVSISVLLGGGADSDGDGIPDDYEIAHGMNPHDPSDALLDFDHDGLSNLREYQLGTNPNLADTDGDGINDGDEVNGTGRACRPNTNTCYHTNPLLADTDGDGFNDYVEVLSGSDPTNAASTNLAGALTGLSVTPANFTLIVNSISGVAYVQLTVTGQLIDNTTVDLTSTTRGTQYQSSDLQKCNFGTPDGRVFASNAGGCTITITAGGRTVFATGTVQNFTPSTLSFVAIPGYTNGIAVQGDIAYVAAGASGLQVVSLSANRLTPTVTGHLALAGNSNYVTLVGNRAYVAGGSAGLQVVDITNPISPSLLGTFSTGSNAMAVKVRGNIAYVATGNSLELVNVSNPAAMIQASSIGLGGTAWALDVDSTRNLAAVAAGSGGAALIDVSNPSTPVVKGTASTGDARCVAIRNNTLIVGDYNVSTTLVDITNQASPHIVTSANLSLGGRDLDIALSGSFALAADVFFVNGVPIFDISDPTQLQPRLILNFGGIRDDNGMGIAVDPSFVYLVADHSGLNRGGTTGDSRLYIGQYAPRVDLAGVPPTVSIVSPTGGSTQYQGAQLTVSVNAVDDVAVASVNFLVNGQLAFTTTSEPFQYTFTLPTGANSITLGATASDLGSNVGTAANVTVPLVPDPLTIVTGLVVDPNNNPLQNASVTVNGGLAAVTGANGRFSIPSVPTILGNIVANATFTDVNNNSLQGSSPGIAPLRGGITDVGTISLLSATFISSYGTAVINCDDCNVAEVLPFTFPYYGVNQTSLYVGSNGYLTFGSPDSQYTESLPAFQQIPRISLFFDDLDTRCAPATVFVNNTIPGKFVVTYDRVLHYSCQPGPNTMQIQLYPDGRIIFAFNGISSLTTGSITGLNPGPNTNSQAVDYSHQTNVNVTPLVTNNGTVQTAIYEYFTAQGPFDIDHTFIVFTPLAGGGYNVRTVLPSTAGSSGIVSGGANAPLSSGRAQVASSAAPAPATLRPSDLANAEVTVRSSGNASWIGMVNTDGNGNFALAGVPLGGVSVTVQRNGKVIATGGGVFTGGPFGTQQVLQIGLAAPAPPKGQ